MNPLENPFVPGAGALPPALVGRQMVLDDIKVALGRVKKGAYSRGSLMIGLRGVGKTVLLVTAEEEAIRQGFEVVRIEAPEEKSLPGLLIPGLRKLLFGLDRLKEAEQIGKRALRVLQGFTMKFTPDGNMEFGLGIDPEKGVADSGNLEADLSSLLIAVGEAARAKEKAVVIIIDEMQYIQQVELGALIAAIHAVGQKNLPLLLIGAGLPQLAALAGEAKSYAERLFGYPLIGPLIKYGGDGKPITTDAEAALVTPVRERGVDINDDAVKEVVRLTEGYPYFIQEWGYEVWNAASASPITLEDVNAVTPHVVEKLDRSFFRVRFDRITPSEKEYLRAMAELGDGAHRSGDIAKLLRVKVETKAPLRSSLIRKGMIYSPAHGDTAFTVPLFGAFMKRMIPNWKPKKSK